jgi:tetratricopeptide (TPR) repeat protein
LNSYLSSSYNKVFSQADELLLHGEHLPAIAKLDALIHGTNDLKFQHLLIIFKINNESFIQNKFENPVKFLWDNLGEISDSFIQHETYIVSLETAIVQKNVNAIEDLLKKSEEFKKSILSSTDDLINYFESMLQFLFSLYFLRIKLDYKETIVYLKDSIKQFSRYNNKIGLIQAYFWLGYAFYKNEEFSEALSIFSKSKELAKDLENKFWQARNSHYLGKIHSEQEQWIDSTTLLNEALELYSFLGLKNLQSGVLIDIVSDLFQIKDFDKIKKYLNDRLDLSKEFKLIPDFISSSYWLAYFYEYTNNVDQALETYQQTLEYLNKIQYLDEIHRCSAHISYLNAHKHDQLPDHLDWRYELKNSTRPWNIVIVCNGNISRSPYIEYIIKRMIENDFPELNELITVRSMGILYPNVKMNQLTEKYLLKDDFSEKEIEKHIPKYWEDYPEIHENASIFITTTGEQAQYLNFYYPGKAFMLSYVAEEKFENIIDPAVHRADAEELFRIMKDFSKKFVKKLLELIEKKDE